ncbi:adenosylcobinamide-phosphate guanylyltransferase [Vibrio astriarenae]|nr:adenosylcobinamide-phosphate guanylyltransferase [Vibrio sp. C7]
MKSGSVYANGRGDTTIRRPRRWMNQAIAKVADNVVFIAAGLPLKLKGEG